MKIIMPIAGKGTRLRPHTHVIPKSLIRVAGKPIISYIIDQIKDVEFAEIIFIIGHLGDQIKSYLRSTYRFPMKFVRQTDFQGLGHAIDQAKEEFQVDESILILLGDIIFTADIAHVINSKDNMLGIMKVDDPSKFGIVTVDKDNFVTSMIEKPEHTHSDLAMSGIYYFTSAFKLFEAIKHLMLENIKTRNEYQLTDAMRQMMAEGSKFRTFNVPELYDCGEKAALLETNRVMLERFAKYDNIQGSIVIPPIFIGNNTMIENSIIGPNVTISEGSCVKNSIITNSILGIETNVENTILNNSLIGDNSSLSESPDEYNIGPDSEIIFNNKAEEDEG
jgi:glucose-1-phosphate thymidylyltransferase